MNTPTFIESPPAYKRQKGVATITISVILLFAITIISIFAGRAGILEQKTAANDFRYKEAFIAAEAGLEDGLRFLKNNTNAIPYNQPTKTLDNGASYTYQITQTSLYYTVSATGLSSDSVGTATVQVLAGNQGIVSSNGPDVPLISDGTATIGGNLEVVANSNAAGTSVPVSVWAHINIVYAGSAATCQLDGYLMNGGLIPDQDPDKQLCDPNDCHCVGAVTDVAISSTAGGDGVDTVDNDAYVSAGGNFPDDLFDYVFGVPRSDWETIRDAAAAGDGGVFSDCSSLDSNSTGIFWIDGDCDISAGTQAGSLDNPVIVVVSEGQLTMRGGASLFGLIYAFDKNDDEVLGGISINGSNIVYGAFVSDTDIDISNGTLNIRYNKHVIQKAFNENPDDLSSAFKQVARVAGTWRDF